MHMNLKFFLAPALGLLMIGCESNGSEEGAAATSRSAEGAEVSREIAVNTSPGMDGTTVSPTDDLAKAQTPPPAGPTTTIEFAEYKYDFGTITQPESVTHMFEFTNTGDEPLVIDNCKGSCGCTVPKCPKEPIQPGAKGQIEVKFNSKGKKDAQTKKVTINANTDPPQTMLTITAFVEVDPAAAGS